MSDRKNLIPGKRYTFPLTIPPDGREKSGLFARYAPNGNAILIAKNGEEWHIPPENCTMIKRSKSGGARGSNKVWQMES